MSSGVRRSPAGDSGSADLRLRLQRLSGPLQVLTVGALAALHSEDGTFSTADVTGMYVELRLPAPRNLSASLGRQLNAGRLVRPTASRWALTPEGENALEIGAADVPVSALAADLGRAPAADLAASRQALIPPFLAPVAISEGLRKLLSSSAFDNNVMLITRFPLWSDDPLAGLVARMRAVCSAHGLTLLLASDGQAEDLLWSNVVTYMWGSRYAVVVVDSLDGVLNSNVLIEVGGMLMTGRRCAILKDRSVPQMPTDLVGHIYKAVDLSDHRGVEQVIHAWIRDDLGLGACDLCAGE